MIGSGLVASTGKDGENCVAWRLDLEARKLVEGSAIIKGDIEVEKYMADGGLGGR